MIRGWKNYFSSNFHSIKFQVFAMAEHIFILKGVDLSDHTKVFLWRSKCVFMKLQYYGQRSNKNYARLRWSNKQILSDHMCFCSIIWSVIGLEVYATRTYLKTHFLNSVLKFWKRIKLLNLDYTFSRHWTSSFQLLLISVFWHHQKYIRRYRGAQAL